MGIITASVIVVVGVIAAVIWIVTGPVESPAPIRQPVAATTPPPKLQELQSHQPLLGTTRPTVPPVAKSSPPMLEATLEMTPDQLFAKASPSVVRIEVRDSNFNVTGTGSGFFITNDGLVVTNYHIVKGAHFATLQLTNEGTLFVEAVAATDEVHDLALLKVTGTDMPFLPMADGSPPTIGTRVFVIGNPRGKANLLSEGLVSAVREVEGDPTAVIETSAPITPGSSGGPLLTADCRVVGVTTALVKESQNLNIAVGIAQVAQHFKNRAKLVTLASAGGKPLEKGGTNALNKMWEAIDRKDWGKALSLLAIVRPQAEGSAYYWFTLGYLHRNMGNYDLAVDAYKASIAIKPDDAIAYVQMSGAYKFQRKHAEAIAACTAAIAIKPDYSDAYYFMGNSYYHLQKYEEAIAACKTAIVFKPDDDDAYRFMGDAYSKLHKYDEAIAAYKGSLAIKPDDATTHYSIGEAYRELHKYDEAIAAYKAAIAIKPDHNHSYYSLGSSYDKLQKYDEAIAAYKASLAIKPDDAITYVAMGYVYRHMRKNDEAIAALQKAVEMDLDDDLRRITLRSIELIKKLSP